MLRLIITAHDEKSWNSDMETSQNRDAPTYLGSQGYTYEPEINSEAFPFENTWTWPYHCQMTAIALTCCNLWNRTLQTCWAFPWESFSFHRELKTQHSSESNLVLYLNGETQLLLHWGTKFCDKVQAQSHVWYACKHHSGACTRGLMQICSWMNKYWQIIFVMATCRLRPSEGNSTPAHCLSQCHH